MTTREFFINALNFFFSVFIIGFAILYFIAGDHFAVFTRIIENLVPVAIFAVLLLIKFNIDKVDIREKKERGEMEHILYLTIFDRLYFDLLNFLLPIAICLIDFFFTGATSASSITASGIVFISLYFYGKYIFSKV